MAQRTGLVEEMTSAEIETLATVLGVSAKAITVALQDFARVLEGHTTAFNSWASRQEEIAARLAAVERRLQLVNAKHARPARRKPGAKPLLELVK